MSVIRVVILSKILPTQQPMKPKSPSIRTTKRTTKKERKKKRKERRLPNKIRDLPGASDCFNTFFLNDPPGTAAEDTPTASGSSQDDSANNSTTPLQDSSSDEETAMVNSDIAASQLYTDDLPTPGDYRFINVPRQRQTVIDIHSHHVPNPTLNQNQDQREWQAPVVQYHLNDPQHLVGLPWGYPQDNTFLVTHTMDDAYTGSAQMNQYAAYPTHHQGPWTAQDGSGSGSGGG